MSDKTSPVERVQADIARSQQTQAAQRLAQYSIAQESASEEFQEWSDLEAYNPLAQQRNFQAMERRVREKARADESAKEEQSGEEEIIAIERLSAVSEDYSRKNPELQPRSLLALRVRISKNDTVEDILRKVREAYPDVSLADEALDFLIETSPRDIKENLRKAKEELNNLYAREIKAGKNMGTQAREFSSQGLGSPTALKDLYRDITGNPRDAHALFQELTTNYPFDKMKAVIDFLLHSLGAELKSKGPSISRPELTRIYSETRNMQAILGVFRFFKSRMRLVAGAFDRQGLIMPARISFEVLAKIFMKFLQERYPSVDKALLLSQQLGLSGNTLAQIILYMQFRDAIRQVAPKLFRDDRHRQEMLLCFIETLEELDEELEEEEEEEKKKKQDSKNQ